MNTDRAVGAILSHHVVKTHGPDGLPDGTISIEFTGSAGQSLGAFLAGGITIRVVGDANDYTGKGLSGGCVIVRPPLTSKFKSYENIIIGNVALYGANGGEAYFSGVAAERFAVRNSGARAVVEGIGDHGCEYMTGGRVVILGSLGRNFAAGMSGGVAYVFDPNDQLLSNINLEMVDIEAMDQPSDIEELKQMIDQHIEYTDSVIAQEIMSDWEANLPLFKKVIPIMYREILQQQLALAASENVGV